MALTHRLSRFDTYTPWSERRQKPEIAMLDDVRDRCFREPDGFLLFNLRSQQSG